MFLDDYKNNIKNNEWFYIANVTDERLSMGEVLKLYVNHPKHNIKKKYIKAHNNIVMEKIESRYSMPLFSYQILKYFQTLFGKGVYTTHFFIGLTDNNTSANGIHKDIMDVMLVQGLGVIDVSIWEPLEEFENNTEITKAQGKCLNTYTLQEGDCVWIPRGIYHFIEPHGERITYSFGVEGEISAAELIK